MAAIYIALECLRPSLMEAMAACWNRPRRYRRTVGMVARQFLAAPVKRVMTVQPDDVRRPERPSSRLLILDRHNRLLLFKFAHRSGPLAGQTFWATPGGGLDPGES